MATDPFFLSKKKAIYGQYFQGKKSNLSSIYKKIKKNLTLNFYRLTKVLYYSNSDIFELETCSFFIKQVRILPEIEKLCYQGARSAKMRLVPAKF